MSSEPAENGDRWDRRFAPGVAAAVALAAVVRLVYVLTDDRLLVGGDGFTYHAEAIRLADGLGYTSVFNGGAPIAHHPPGWVTLLGLVSWLGGRSQHAHQLVGAALGLALVVLAALVGRRYFDAATGLVAAVLTALYPGFWLLEGNMLSEPLGLVILGVFTLLVADLRDRPTWTRSVAVGVVSGLLALTRSEQLALVAMVVVPILLAARSLSWGMRIGRVALVGVTCVAVIAPWTIYNSSRFKEPVVLSSNGGPLLLLGNCSPGALEGRLMGYEDGTCLFRISRAHPHYDRSQLDDLARRTALTEVRDHLDRLPLVVPARVGRMLAVFRPTQTVDLVAGWMTTGTTPIWAWVVSFWVLLALAIAGVAMARGSLRACWPLIAPFLLAVGLVAISYGEPRYHSPADLGIVVFAASAIVRIAQRRSIGIVRAG
jgi:4-amino-4-deoxy-L-arabinose transferase-like glycosyltransferase